MSSAVSVPAAPFFDAAAPPDPPAPPAAFNAFRAAAAVAAPTERVEPEAVGFAAPPPGTTGLTVAIPRRCVYWVEAVIPMRPPNDRSRVLVPADTAGLDISREIRLNFDVIPDEICPDTHTVRILVFLRLEADASSDGGTFCVRFVLRPGASSNLSLCVCFVCGVNRCRKSLHSQRVRRCHTLCRFDRRSGLQRVTNRTRGVRSATSQCFMSHTSHGGTDVISSVATSLVKTHTQWVVHRPHYRVCAS